MIKHIPLLLLVVFIFASCKKSEPEKPFVIYDHNTGLSVTLPLGFEKLNDAETNKILNVGGKFVEENFDKKVDFTNKEIAFFKSNDTNYFIFNVKDFETESHGKYQLILKKRYDLQYDSYQKMFEGSKIDSLHSKEIMDKVEFSKLYISIKLPNTKFMKIISYATLKDKKDISIMMMYDDEELGMEMKKAINTIQFKK